MKYVQGHPRRVIHRWTPAEGITSKFSVNGIVWSRQKLSADLFQELLYAADIGKTCEFPVTIDCVRV
jgi:hypothetical protein